MDKQTAHQIKQDFREWSGGFSPESKDQISVYVEYALVAGIDPNEVMTLLYEWMESEDSDSDLPERAVSGELGLSV